MSPGIAPSKSAAPMAVAWRAAAAVAALAVYALLSNWLMVHATDHAWTVALLFGPLLLAVAALGLRRRQAHTLLACAALLLVLIVVVWRGGVAHAQRLYVLQHAGLHLALGWSFALTLRAGDKPFITALAEVVHGRLGHTFTPALAQYTRAVTVLWVGYFLGMVGVSGLIYLLAPWSWWSLYCTVLTPVSVVVLFVGEHVWRERRHPEFPRVSMRAVVAAYRRSGKAAAP